MRGWRAAFWAVVAISAPAVVAVMFAAPVEPPAESTPNAKRELSSLRPRKLQLMLALGAPINGATFCSFTYMASTRTDISGFDPRWIPLLLGLFGLGSFIGVNAGGRLADTQPFQLLAVGSEALLTEWIVFALMASHPSVTLVMLFVQGALSFTVGSTLISPVLYAADGAPTLGGSFATAAFNVGATLRPALGGRSEWD